MASKLANKMADKESTKKGKAKEKTTKKKSGKKETAKAAEAVKAGNSQKATIRESASRLKKDLEEFLDLVEKGGSQISPEELQGFEERQFEHITSKIADAIISKVGEKAFNDTTKALKAGKISLTEASSKLGLKMGDLVLALEARKVFSEAELRKRLTPDRKP